MAKTKQDYFDIGVKQAIAIFSVSPDSTKLEIGNGAMPNTCSQSGLSISLNGSWQAKAWREGFRDQWQQLKAQESTKTLHSALFAAAKADARAKAKDRATGANLYAVKEHVRILCEKVDSLQFAGTARMDRYNAKINLLRDRWGI